MNRNPLFWNENSQSFCGRLRQLLSIKFKDLTDSVMIESPFRETTRNGKVILRFVRLAITSNAFVIASVKEHDSATRLGRYRLDLSSHESLTVYPWKSIKLSVFKRSKRQTIKVIFPNKSTRYYELRKMPKMKVYWNFWCSYIEELKATRRRWPFIVVFDNYTNQLNFDYDSIQNANDDKKHSVRKWTDKYLYLGSLREVEDKIRPRPVPGLGKTEEIKLLYLKPRYFGCWEQSEHWVQCGESSPEIDCLVNNK
ncbi:uncharacterized protein LOC142974223 [Anticarsia gemmatalis]|uniref:uncharacterized protein LOC142974223 n=1 Tax=Anticarsia gemmatalis TaxID=129554 RepID=UPI003F7763C3